MSSRGSGNHPEAFDHVAFTDFIPNVVTVADSNMEIPAAWPLKWVQLPHADSSRNGAPTGYKTTLASSRTHMRAASRLISVLNALLLSSVIVISLWTLL